MRRVKKSRHNNDDDDDKVNVNVKNITATNNGSGGREDRVVI
jgi:hypothetical protein